MFKIIVCFGDSLTVGYQSPTRAVPSYHVAPYGAVLQKWFGARGSVMIRGVNGETTSEMVNRFSRDVVQDAPHSVVILGGTNDIGLHLPSTAIFNNLIHLYELARGASIEPIAVTIPSLRMTGEGASHDLLEREIEQRVEINQNMKAYCGKAGISCLDLFSHTVEEGSVQLAEVYSNDGIHLSTDGYELLATLLWEEVWAPEFGAPEKDSTNKSRDI